MALNQETITFLVKQIQNSDDRTFISTVKQLYTYLSNEIKDNPIYDKYEKERVKWTYWPILDENFSIGRWDLPDNLEDTKSLTYDIYKSIAEHDKHWAHIFAFNLFRESNSSENVYKLNFTFAGYFVQALEEIVNANPEIEVSLAKKVNNKTVFIVHGHDNELKTEVQLLVKRAGVKNRVLHEQADKRITIIDRLVDKTASAGYAIVLLTPDDLIKDGNKRTRQNVILETGYFLGSLGKERIRMIVKGDIEIPGDLQGILYEKYDKSGAWKFKLLKELQSVGIYADIQAAINEF